MYLYNRYCLEVAILGEEIIDEGKKMSSAFQNIKSAPKGSDCKTKHTLDIILDKSYAGLYVNRYIVDKDGSLVLLTKSNIDKYIGKMVHLRSPLFCGDKNHGYCNKCLGELFYILGIAGNSNTEYEYGIGLIANRISSVIMNQDLKKMHDMSIHLKHLEISNYIKKIN